MDWLNVRAVENIKKGMHCKIILHRDLVLCEAENASYTATTDIPAGSLLAINEYGGDGLAACQQTVQFFRKVLTVANALTVELDEVEQKMVIDRLARSIRERIDAQIVDIMLGRR